MEVARAPPENPSRMDLGPHTLESATILLPNGGKEWTHKEVIKQDI